MPFSRGTFLGASLVSLNCSIGWRSNPSQYNFVLVEDIQFGDAFLSPSPGTPVEFSYESILIRGIVVNWKHKQSTSGKFFNVTVQDPRHLLDDTHLILNNYTGAVTTP